MCLGSGKDSGLNATYLPTIPQLRRRRIILLDRLDQYTVKIVTRREQPSLQSITMILANFSSCCMRIPSQILTRAPRRKDHGMFSAYPTSSHSRGVTGFNYLTFDVNSSSCRSCCGLYYANRRIRTEEPAKPSKSLTCLRTPSH